MVIVRIAGGLGNQMFQYALYEKLISLGKDVKADTIGFYEKGLSRQYELEMFPNVYLEKASNEEIQFYYHNAKKWHYKVIGRLLENQKKIRSFEEAKYCEDVYWVKDAYIYGYWQSEKYFTDIEAKIRKKFIFPEIYDIKNLNFLEQIEKENSVSIHVRRGDYLSKENQRIYGGICTIQYYEQAIKYFEDRYKDVTFFVFSNDIMWAQKNLKMKRSVVVNANNEDNAIFDMLLMAKCKHNIIANSSFSWWGAWLNEHKDKIVLSPSRWMNTEPVEDIWCEGWIKIDGQKGKCNYTSI